LTTASGVLDAISFDNFYFLYSLIVGIITVIVALIGIFAVIKRHSRFIMIVSF